MKAKTCECCEKKIPNRPYQDPGEVRACSVECAVQLQKREHPEYRNAWKQAPYVREPS